MKYEVWTSYLTGAKDEYLELETDDIKEAVECCEHEKEVIKREHLKATCEIRCDCTESGWNIVELYTADRETGTFIEKVNSIAEGKALIEGYEENDKAEGCYKTGFYDIVTSEERISVL